jgi:diadenosine tetraphosphate (Ap4A) HIT family hydrolase
MGVPSCPHCSLAPDDAWLQTELVVAVPHPTPLVSCDLIVAPRRHVAAFYDLDVQEQSCMWEAITQLCVRIKLSIAVDGFNAGFVDAPIAGDSEFHAYIRLLPRIPGERVVLPEGAEWVDLGPLP